MNDPKRVKLLLLCHSERRYHLYTPSRRFCSLKDHQPHCSLDLIKHHVGPFVWQSWRGMEIWSKLVKLCRRQRTMAKTVHKPWPGPRYDDATVWRPTHTPQVCCSSINVATVPVPVSHHLFGELGPKLFTNNNLHSGYFLNWNPGTSLVACCSALNPDGD